ncbi:putative nucleotidyltransferase [Helianthus annuus]|nr:putative nucleotidyltransferase [Helianthus annuus]
MKLILFVIISGEVPAAAMEPMPESFVSPVEDRKLEDREKWWKMGLKAISDGKLVVLLLSGGQVFIYFTFFIIMIHNSVGLGTIDHYKFV